MGYYDRESWWRYLLKLELDTRLLRPLMYSRKPDGFGPDLYEQYLLDVIDGSVKVRQIGEIGRTGLLVALAEHI
jgi:hypothetical protein